MNYIHKQVLGTAYIQCRKKNMSKAWFCPIGAFNLVGEKTQIFQIKVSVQ